MSARQKTGFFFIRLFFGQEFAEKVKTAVSVKVDDSPGWSAHGRYPHDRDPADQQQLYYDTLTAWRKNPLAWRIIQITTDYTVGEEITISSPDPTMQAFITEFWNHPQNRLSNRLEKMSDELARSGDLFALLFRNSASGMSYLRFLTKDQIETIETKPSDWETELTILQRPTEAGKQPKRWYTPHNSRHKRARAVALHYVVNQPMGATFGESDLATAVPWLLRYSRLLEDRVRMHWAIRAFLWIVTVPSNKVLDKSMQYATPPESGSVIVKDDSEEWEAKSPVIRGSDAAPDMKAVRGMVDASSGYPPHWRGEATDVNLATAQAMQEPAEKHLKRRQNYFAFVLKDIIYNAYLRAHQLYPAKWPIPEETNFDKLFTAVTPDISKTDNSGYASSALNLSQAYANLAHQMNPSASMTRRFLSILFKFIGEPIDDDDLDIIMQELNKPAPTQEQKETAVYKRNGTLTQ